MCFRPSLCLHCPYSPTPNAPGSLPRLVVWLSCGSVPARCGRVRGCFVPGALPSLQGVVWPFLLLVDVCCLIAGALCHHRRGLFLSWCCFLPFLLRVVSLDRWPLLCQMCAASVVLLVGWLGVAARCGVGARLFRSGCAPTIQGVVWLGDRRWPLLAFLLVVFALCHLRRGWVRLGRGFSLFFSLFFSCHFLLLFSIVIL